MEFGDLILVPEDVPHPVSPQDHLAPLIMDTLHEHHADSLYTETFDIGCPYDSVIRLYGPSPADYVFLHRLSAETCAQAIQRITPNHWSTEDDIIRALEDHCDWVHRFQYGEI